MIAKALHLNSLGGRINISEQLTSHCTDEVGPTYITQQVAGQSQYVRLSDLEGRDHILNIDDILFLYMWSYQVVVVCLLVMTRRL